MCNLPWLKILDKFGLTLKLWPTLKMKAPICKLARQLSIQLCHVVTLTWFEPFDGSYFGHALSDLYVNVSLSMTRFVMDYIMHQQDLPKPTSINVSHG